MPHPSLLDRATTLLATVEVREVDDVSRLRRAVGHHADALGFSSVDRTRLVTAASELGRNMLGYGGGGETRLERVDEPGTTSLRIVFLDRGPGIPDIEQALVDGYSTGRGLGLGLGGARRLVEEFSIAPRAGGGLRIAIARGLRDGPSERRPSALRSSEVSTR